MRRTVRRTAWLAAAAVGTAALLGARAGDPELVWLPVEGGRVGDFRDAPDGAPVPHAATMQDPDGAWAYRYREPSRLGDLLDRLGLRGGATVDYLATGREARTRSGRWREFRRCTGAELAAAVRSRGTGPRARR